MLGDRIRNLRKEKGYSITELAELAGVSKSYLSYIERDLQNNPSLQFLLKISAPLDTSIEYLLGNEESRPNTIGKLDEEWEKLIQKAISEGFSKEDFQNYREYITFSNWRRLNRRLETENNE